MQATRIEFESTLLRRRAAILFGFFITALAVATFLVTLHVRTQRQRQRNRYDAIIWEKARRHSISPLLVKAVIRRESNFDALAVGAAGEIGLMQITEGAVLDWERYSGQRCALRGLLFNARLNIEIGTWYLANGLKRWRHYRDADALALAQYNAGPSKAKQWAPDDPRVPVSMTSISFPQTREYIINVRKYWTYFEKEYAAREHN